MQVTENNQNIEEISVPITACPIEDVLDYTVEVAGYIIDTKDIYDYFKSVLSSQDERKRNGIESVRLPARMIDGNRMVVC